MPMSLAASGLLTSLRGIWIVLTRLFYSITHATFIIVSFLKKFNKKLLQQCIKNKLCYNFAYKKDHIITMVQYIYSTNFCTNQLNSRALIYTIATRP